MRARALIALCLAAPAVAAVTYSANIAPILNQYCAPCHRPGESAPFSLLTYEDARKHAAQIAAVTKRRYMPPWLPEPGYGDFAGERRLTDSQIRLIEKWSRAGAPEGTTPRRAQPFPSASEWSLGPPDLIIEARQPIAIPAEGRDLFWNFILSPQLNTARFVKAIEIRPGNTQIVHHANVVIDRARSSRRREASPGAGFPGMDLTFESDSFDPDSHFLFWKPGATPRAEHTGIAWRLDPASDLILNVHLRAYGKPETIRPAIGLYFTEIPPNKLPMLVKLENDRAIDIPPGARDVVISDDFRLPLDADLLAVYPHAHYLGKLLEAYATLPDGSRRGLIRIPQWDVNWQSVYPYRQPVFLPKGSVISMRFHYENATNHRVRSGNQATDEMGHLWLQVLPRGTSDSRPLLQEALMRHRLEKYPDDSAAHLTLGTLLLNRKDAAGAIPHLRLLPDQPQALNNLGAALKLEGRLADATEAFRRALAIQADYPNARFNLATALQSQGKLAESAAEFRRLPNDPEAREQLVAILIDIGNAAMSARQPTAAAEAYRELIALKPSDPDLLNNYGIILAALGDRTAAIQQFEAALKINPAHESARRNLERVRGNQ